MVAKKHRLSLEREELVEEQAALLSQNELSAEEQSRDDYIAMRIKDIDRELVVIERREASQPPVDNSWMVERQETYMAQLVGQSIAPPSLPQSDGAKAFLGRLFRNERLSLDGFKSPEEFYKSLYQGAADPRFKLLAVQHGLSDPGGGFSMPSTLAYDVLGKAYSDSIVLNRATVVPMNTREKFVWGFDNSDGSSGNLFGGFEPTWHAETSTESVQTAELTQIKLHAHTMFLLAQSSDELIEDGPAFAEELSNAMGQSIAFALDAACLSEGSGVGMPLAIANCSSLIEVAAEAAQTSDTIKYLNLIKIMARMHPACFPNSVWIVHPSTLPELLNLVIGTSESFYPVLSEASGELRMLSRPVLLSEKMSTLGDKFDILLVDLSQYLLGLRKEISIERSSHLGFSSGTTYFRSRVRADGLPRWAKDSAYTPRQGSDSLSWCVTLAARA